MEKSNINPTSIRLRKDLFEKIKKDAEKDKRSITFCLVDTFSQQVALSVYPIP